MKILDRYILTTYLKTFMSVFVILMLIFILQSIWLYIGELAGRDLSFLVVYKFLLYATPTLIPLILPLTILLSSIMVFGSLAENYEFAAMKSTGISLQRAMRALSVFILLLAVVVFFFANNVIPAANFNFYNLRKNIAQRQPALAITAGQFNQIGDINIKVEEKYGDNDQLLRDVIIHKKYQTKAGNFRVMKAETGELKSSLESNVLQLVLFDGHYYEEVQSNDRKQAIKKPFVKSAFDEYIINVDLEGLNDVDMEDKSYDNRYNMLDISALNYTIDSLENQRERNFEELTNTLYSRSAINNLNINFDVKENADLSNGVLELFDTRTKSQILSLAKNSINSSKQIILTKTQGYSQETKWLNRHIISLHEKYALGLACIILFFVGAPLGALIRKGGIGLPMVIAILLFLTYHFIGIFSKNGSQDGSFSPIIGTWLSTLIMLPLSIYLTSRATKDRGLFDVSTYLDPLRKFLGLKSKYKLKNEDGGFRDYSFITHYSNDKLIGVIKNYDQLQFNKQSKVLAYNQLLANGIRNEVLEERGLVIDKKFIESSKDAKNAIKWSKVTFFIYILSASFLILHFVFKNNNFPEWSQFVLIASIIGFVLFLISFISTYTKVSTFKKDLDVPTKRLNPILMILGFPFYMVSHFFLKNKIREDLGSAVIENIK
ncbi:LptF/LptG family permease [Aegicerativicinus sediminis]|uniref:LptF/LptG family permease n=1 Tax=Aegicerativicinus sediminis TaxID=2893202 RepID=UPI0021CFE9D9|nr:LptF/LptG family permease [Aegicerativicinus sediminis]